MSFEDETSVNTPRRGPHTRSKVNCRQTQLTDSFSRIGARNTTKRSEDQSSEGQGFGRSVSKVSSSKCLKCVCWNIDGLAS